MQALMRGFAAALLAGLSAPAAAAEEEPFSFEDFLNEPRQWPIEEIAADLTYGFCIPYLAGQFPLTGNEQLVERGFGDAVTRTPNERFGELEQVSATQADGSVAFGGVPDKVCSVTVTGADYDKVLAKLRTNMAFMGLDFQPDAANSGDRGSATLETFKAPLEGQILYVQLARVSQPEDGVAAQVFGMAE